VILTHLHWDHAGGVGRLQEDGTTVLTFPHAQHFVHGIEWDVAFSGDPLLGQSYPPATLAPLRDALQDQVLLVTDAAPDVLPGVRMARTGGHTEGHCAVVLSDRRLVLHHPRAGDVDGPDTIVFAGDACPTHGHLRMVYQTAYDTRPLDTRAWKRRFLAEIAAEQYLLMFCHDPVLFGATLQPDPNHIHEVAIDRSLPIA
jgi:glyoxylase-like metal-dependent hydrolase (beta-lactamase superfamily II)